MTERVVAPAREPAGVRRRCLPPAPHAAHRTAAPARGAARGDVRRGSTGQATGCGPVRGGPPRRRWSTSCSILSRAGEHEQPGSEVDLGEAADRALERWRKAAKDAERRARARTAEGRRVDGRGAPPADLDRALDALIENAIRYAPPRLDGHDRHRPGGMEILDEGPGIEPGEEEGGLRALPPRQRRATGRRQGTGLGLPIARELVGAMGRLREHRATGTGGGLGQ